MIPIFREIYFSLTCPVSTSTRTQGYFSLTCPVSTSTRSQGYFSLTCPVSTSTRTQGYFSLTCPVSTSTRTQGYFSLTCPVLTSTRAQGYFSLTCININQDSGLDGFGFFHWNSISFRCIIQQSLNLQSCLLMLFHVNRIKGVKWMSNCDRKSELGETRTKTCQICVTCQFICFVLL